MYVDFLDLSSIIDKVYQLLAHGQWLSPDTQASSTTKTGRHDIAETLLKVALNTINQIKSITDKTITGLYCMSNSVGVLYETAYYIEHLDSIKGFFFKLLCYCLFSDDGFNVHFQIRVP